jgi:hypothetical protein
MKWIRGHRSPHVIDRRGASGLGGASIAGFAPMLLRMGRPGIILLLLLAGLWFFGDRFLSDSGEQTGGDGVRQGQSDPMVSFVSFVLDDVQATWDGEIEALGRRYEPAKLVLFTGQTHTSGCGFGAAAVGPFYCPADGRVYIDLSFYDQLRRRFGAPGDFAQAYVIAHEIGHHVQNLLGISDRVRRAPSHQRSGAEGLSVRLELQADCFAGVWAAHARRRDLLETGDVEEALGAAAAIGDDRLQRRSGGAVQPESWTHGSSEQRARWFRRGLERGDPRACDTFAARAL